MAPPSVNIKSNGHLPPLTTLETAQLAVFFCLLWFIANWTLNASLDYTWVASATILSSTSGRFYSYNIIKHMLFIPRLLHTGNWQYFPRRIFYVY